MKKIASANLLIPETPFGNRIRGSEHESLIVLIVSSSSCVDASVDPPTIIAVVPIFSSAAHSFLSFPLGFSGSNSAR